MSTSVASGPVPAASAQQLTDLTISSLHGEATTLDGLQCLTGIERLEIASSAATNLDPLAALTRSIGCT